MGGVARVRRPTRSSMLYLAELQRTLGDQRQDADEGNRPVPQQREESLCFRRIEVVQTVACSGLQVVEVILER
jgi:hypothetical protein